MHFSLKDLNRNPLDVKNRLIKDMYSRPALIPEMPWLGHSALKKPAVKRAEKNDSGHTLYIEDAKSTVKNGLLRHLPRRKGKAALFSGYSQKNIVTDADIFRY